MSDQHLNWITNFIRGIADDVLRNACVLGTYRHRVISDIVAGQLHVRNVSLPDADAEITHQAGDSNWDGG